MGRPAGIPNKASGAIKELAQGYGADVIRSLADLAGFGAPGLRAEADMTRIVAMRELLDRGFGKATQPLSGEAGGAIQIIVETGVPRVEEG
jgi:hypothetical protein